MISFTINTLNDNKSGTTIGFKINLDLKGPSKIEFQSLKPYLTQKAQRILLDYVAANRKLRRQTALRNKAAK